MIYFWERGAWQSREPRKNRAADTSVLKALQAIEAWGDFTGYQMAEFELQLRAVYLDGILNGIESLTQVSIESIQPTIS